MKIILVGASGMGKTTEIKRHIAKSKKTKLGYALISQDFEGVIPIERDFKTFVDKAVKMKNTMFIIDEASTALPNEQPDATKNTFERNLKIFFLNSRKCNNVVFIVYHTMREVPVWLIAYANYFLRFNTSDQLQHQLTRFQSFPTIVKSIQENPIIPKYEYEELFIQPQ